MWIPSESGNSHPPYGQGWSSELRMQIFHLGPPSGKVPMHSAGIQRQSNFKEQIGGTKALKLMQWSD
jgi:hypothetical protein